MRARPPYNRAGGLQSGLNIIHELDVCMCMRACVHACEISIESQDICTHTHTCMFTNACMRVCVHVQYRYLDLPLT